MGRTCGPVRQTEERTARQRRAGSRHVQDRRSQPARPACGAHRADRRLLQSRLESSRRDRRRPVRADHRRLPRRGHEDRRHRCRHRRRDVVAEGSGEMDDPHSHGALRRRGNHLRHGGGIARVLRADHPRHDRRRLRRADRGRHHHAWRRRRHAWLDDQSLRDGDRLQRRRCAIHQRHASAVPDPRRRLAHLRALRDALRRARPQGSVEVSRRESGEEQS